MSLADRMRTAAEVVEEASRLYGYANPSEGYFCGCCWTEIRKMQQRAMEILAAQEGIE